MDPIEVKAANRCLPDVADKGLKVVFCGIAAGKESARLGHHYGHPQNRFWPILQEAGFTTKQIKPAPTTKEREANFDLLLKKKIGLTDLVIDQCGNDDELVLDRTAIKQARFRLMLFIIRWQPQYLAFNGKKTAKLYFGKDDIDYGLQSPSHDIGDTKFFVLPSTSPAASRWWQSSKHHWHSLSKLVK